MTYSSLLQTAYDNAKRFLWPFRFGVWSKLFLIYLFAGPTFTGVPNIKGTIPRSSQVESKVTKTSPPAKQDRTKQILTERFDQAKTLWEENKAAVISLGALIGVAFLLIVFLMLWFYCRMSFVAVHVVDRGVLELRQAWRETGRLGDSFFRFNLYLSIASLVLLSAVVVPVVFGFISGGRPSPAAIAGIVFALIAALAFVFAFSLAYGTLIAFLPVAMVEKKELVLASLRRIAGWCRANKMNALVHVLFYWAINIGIGIASTLAVLIFMFVVGVPAGLIGALVAVAVAKFAVGLKWFMIAGGIVFALAVFLLVLMVTMVPAQTFLLQLRLQLVKNPDIRS